MHLDTYYKNEAKNEAQPVNFLLGKKISKNSSIFLNGAVHTLWKIIKTISASAEESEL